MAADTVSALGLAGRRAAVGVEVMMMLLSGVLLGFLAGLFAFRVKSRWCPRCGEPTHAMPPVEGNR
ncbi:hypothetical protein Vqi01_39520 [Micromonospora qiuiae]|uniref:Uncharacterized protein n=1 Tax=Micromonospora qiuiae TaxID=502268 RepID=A0ABQ4JFE4_9ACTN|nr:hypothetical protein Vqi01_39520 [Micromonospora qiuiae]